MVVSRGDLRYGKLSSIICAGLNRGGAIILTGIEEDMKITGSLFSSRDKEEIQEIFLSCMSSIFPKIEYPEIVLDFVPVLNQLREH